MLSVVLQGRKVEAGWRRGEIKLQRVAGASLKEPFEVKESRHH